MQNVSLTNLVFLARKLSYASSFFPLRFMALALLAWAIQNQSGKNEDPYITVPTSNSDSKTYWEKVLLENSLNIQLYMGYWPSVRSRLLDIDHVLILHVYGQRQGWGPWTRKKEQGQYPAILTKQAQLIKDLVHMFTAFWGNFSSRTQQSRRQDGLPARVTNGSAGFDSSCPLTELAIYM